MELKTELFRLAQEQYDDLREENKFEDCVGAENTKEVIFKNNKYNIKIIGFWEKQNWFEFLITGEDGFKYSGDYCN
jgi:hypothetical protein